MATFDIVQNRGTYDWEPALFNLFSAGGLTLAEADGAQASVTVVSGTITFTFTGTGLNVAGGALTAGTITDITFVDSTAPVTSTIFTISATSVDYTALNALLSGGAQTGRDATFQNVFAAQATTFTDSSGGPNTFFGSSDADSYALAGSDGDFNYVWSGGGDDTVTGSGAFDFFDAKGVASNGAGITVDFDAGTITNNDDSSPAGVFDDNVEAVAGTDDGDTFEGDERDNFMWGNGGDDTLNGNGGQDEFTGGAGSDQIDGGEDQGDSDNWDTVRYDHEENDNQGAQGVFVNLTDTGSDDINGWNSGGVDAGTAVDTYGDIDTLAGIEAVQGTSHDDTIFGGESDNDLKGHGGNDAIFGGRGNDFIEGGAGGDQLHGDNPDWSGQEEDENDDNGDDRYWDTLSYQNEVGSGDGFGVTVNVDSGNATIDGDTDWFGGFENYRGTLEKDTFNGANWDDSFEGLAGDDTFIGGGGEDRVEYSADADFAGGTNGVTVNLGTVDVDGHYQGTATDGFGDTDTLVDITHVSGTDSGDAITGSDLANRIEGRDGDDEISGGGGRDSLQGNGGSDLLDGGDGRDQIEGGDGDDEIDGGSGNDDIDGGRGNDSIDAGTGDDQIRAGSGNDDVDGGVGYDELRYDNYDRNDDEHTATGIQVILDGSGEGSGSISGTFGVDESDNPASVDTIFNNIERIYGSHGSDTFTATDAGFVGTIESDRTFGGSAWRDKTVITFIGGDSSDTFNVTSGAIIDYGEEVWGHDYDDFNGDDNNKWGDHGEFGVVVNLSSGVQNVTQTQHYRENENDGGAELDDVESRTFTIAAGYAADTYSGDGSDDATFDQIIAANAFRLTDADDIIWASDTGTFVDGRWGNDSFYGGTGDDQFNGDRGNDYAEGGDGDDELNGDDGDDELHGGGDNDDIGAGQGDDALYGDAGNDNLNGDDGDDELHGGTGNDNLNGSQGNDELHGEDGQDELRGDDGEDTLYGGDGNDNLEGGQDNDQLEGEGGNDQLRGGDGNDTLLGQDGDDRLEGHSDNDSVNGGDGNDRLWGDDGSDSLVGGSGDDEIEGGGNNGNDIISGDDDITVGGNVITNRAALEIGAAPGGSDMVWAGDGNDLIFGGGGSDEIEGDDGDDQAYGGTGNDTMRGGQGNDSLFGGQGNDRLRGDDDNDSLAGGSGHDNLDGGDGNDVLLGDDGNDMVQGGDGNDTLTGGEGMDNLGGGNGNDRLIADIADRLYGDDGNDTYVLGSLTQIVDMGEGDHDGSGIDTIETTIDRDLTTDDGNTGFHFQNIENATITTSADGIDLIGNDLNNVLVGGTGSNVLDGGAGNDSIAGGGDNDRIIGGAGKDVLTGGANNDQFVFLATSESGTSASTRDIIRDFVHGQDKINLKGIDARTVSDSGNDAFSSAIVKGTASTSFAHKQGTIIWYQENNSGSANDRTIIRVNTDTDNSTEMTIELKGLINLTASDFIL